MKVLLVLLLAYACKAQDSGFPDGFTFGTISAAYSIEGAWNEDGKGENIWDRLTHSDPCHIEDCSNGDVAADAYHKTDEDVQLLADIGVNHYSFSLSWSRILPTGQLNNVNQEGIDYYNGLIDTLIAIGITPYVSIYHWDLPQALQELGGWPNAVLADYYVNYADLVFSLFGDRVKNWITFSQPHMFSVYGYSYGALAPAYQQDGVGGLLCSYTVLMAHARAYRLYDENYRDTQGGRVGISFDSAYFVPEDPDNEADVTAASNYMIISIAVFAYPIFTEDGNYPPPLIQVMAANSEAEGFPSSRLPTLTDEEIELIKGTADFFGVDHVSYQVCRGPTEDDDVAIPSFANDLGGTCYMPEELDGLAPWGLRNLLNLLKDSYNNTEMIIFENGYGDDTGTVNDCNRVNYLNQYLEALLAAINEDGVNVVGYTVKSFLDGFEWVNGYQKFGLVNVDFSNANRTRTRKMSSYVYQNIIETGAIDWDYTPDGFDACDFSSK